MPAWTSRLIVTVIVLAGAINTVRLIWKTTDAVEQIDLTEDAMAELTQHITGAHATMRERVAIDDPAADEVLAEFGASFDRRLARLTTLSAEVREATAHVGSWTGGFVHSGTETAGLRAVDAERRRYLEAVNTARTEDTSPYHASGIRLLDLQAQKLIAAIAAQREHTDAAKTGALLAAETTVAFSFPAAALLITWLLWRRGADD